jgi:excisionase family DNA binding protein
MATRLLAADEVRRILGVDRSTVYRMAGDGRLPAVKVGRQWRFPADRVDELLTLPVHPSSAAPDGDGVPPGCEIDPDAAAAVIDVAAEALGVMMVVTDMSGRPVTGVANACPWFEQHRDDPEILAGCIAEWRDLADSPDFAPRFGAGPLGFECARAFVRSGSELVGMVLAGGVAPAGQPAGGLYDLDAAGRDRVLHLLPRVATALSRLAGHHAQRSAS